MPWRLTAYRRAVPINSYLDRSLRMSLPILNVGRTRTSPFEHLELARIEVI